MSSVAVVTGSAGGIGRGYAEALAADGHRVVVSDINLAGAEETVGRILAAGGRAIAVRTDITDPDSAAALADTVRSEFGRLDILVNNAAFFNGLKLGSALEADPDYWRKVLHVNLDGVLIVTRALWPLIRDSGGGRIINQGSTAAYMGGSDPYTISKAAVSALTVGLAGDLGKHGITVNAIAPGPVPTEAMKGHVSNEMLQWLVGRTPVARAGSIEDMVNALRFLVAPASDYVTAQILVVDGGLIKRI